MNKTQSSLIAALTLICFLFWCDCSEWQIQPLRLLSCY